MKLSLHQLNLLLATAAVAVLAVVVIRARAPRGPVGLINEIDLPLGKILQWQNLDLDLDHASVHKTVAVLNRSLAEHPETAGLRAALWTEKEWPSNFYLAEKPPGPSRTKGPAERGITIHITAISFYQALMEIERVSGYTVGRMGETIYLVRGRGSFGPMTEWTMEIDENYTALLSRTFAVKEHLRSGGMTFYEGSSVQMLSRDRVRVHNLEREREHAGAVGIRFPPSWPTRFAEARSFSVEASTRLWYTIKEKLNPPPPLPSYGAPGPEEIEGLPPEEGVSNVAALPQIATPEEISP